MPDKDSSTVMHSVPCTQSQNIVDIKNDINGLHKIIDGNGAKGMKTDIALLIESTEHIKKKLSGTMEVNTELEIIRRVREQEEKIRKDFEDKKNVRFSKAAKIIGLVFTGIAVCTSLILGVLSFVNTKKIPIVEDKLTNEIRLMDGVSKQSRSGYVKYRDNVGFTDSIKVQ